MEEQNKKISELIRKFDISLHGENQLKVWNKPSQSEIEELRERKTEIISELKRKEEEQIRLEKEKVEQDKKELEEELKKPLFFEKEEGSYFACDQSWEIVILSPSRRLKEDEKKEFDEVHRLAEKMGKTETMPHIAYTGRILAKGFPDGKLKLSQVLEYLEKMPEYEETMKKEAEKKSKIEEQKKQYEEQKEKAIAEAKRTRTNQVIRVLGHYDGDGDKEAEAEFGKECGIITIYELATPNGEIIESGSAAY